MRSRSSPVAHRLAAIDLVPTHPLMQHLGDASNLQGHGLDGCDSDGYSQRCSSTIRTAGSRASWENFFDLFVAPFF